MNITKSLLEAINDGIKMGLEIDDDDDFTGSIFKRTSAELKDHNNDDVKAKIQLDTIGILPMLSYELGLSRFDKISMGRSSNANAIAWQVAIDNNGFLVFSKPQLDAWDSGKINLSNLVLAHNWVMYPAKKLEDFKRNYINAYNAIEKNSLLESNSAIGVSPDEALMVVINSNSIVFMPTYCNIFPKELANDPFYKADFQLLKNDPLYIAMRKTFDGNPNKLFEEYHFIPRIDNKDHQLYLELKFPKVIAKLINYDIWLTLIFTNKELTPKYHSDTEGFFENDYLVIEYRVVGNWITAQIYCK